jgi:hypothetical protein
VAAISTAIAPPHHMTLVVDAASTTMPPNSAATEIVAWNDEVNRTVAASGARGADRTNQVWEHTGTPP